MYKKVLFCIPPIPNIWGWPTDPHLGIGYLCALLDKNHIENGVLDMRLGYKVEDLIRKINAFKPDLVGMNLVSYRRDISYGVLGKIRNPAYRIVVGGAHVSSVRKVVLEECPADFAVKMEGEYTLLELCQGKSPAKTKGLIYRNGAAVVENEDRPLIEDLDELPFPRYEKFELDKYSRRLVSVVSSRGCPYQCVFCAVRASMGNYCRMRSPENVVEELKYWYTRGYREIDFRDDIPNFSRERIYEICRLIEKNGLQGLDLKCGNGLRADLTDKELLRKMFDAGFREVAFGAESGSERILRRIKKGEGLPAIKRAIRDACEIGYDVSVSFMVGYPDETPSDFEESIKLALEYPVAAARFYNTIPFPGTELYDWVKENNYFIKRAQDYLNDIAHFENEPVFATPQFSYEERKKALLKARKITGCVGRRAMERKLRCYGLLAGPLSLLVYSPLGRRIIFAAMANKALKRMLMPVLKILRLNFYMV